MIMFVKIVGIAGKAMESLPPVQNVKVKILMKNPN